MIALPICGALAAAYLTPPVVVYFKASGLPIPNPADDTTTLAAAFLIGSRRCGSRTSCSS